MLKAAVFLDRDGVLNRNSIEDGRPIGPRSLDEFVIFLEVPDAIAALRRAGYMIFVATNQPGAGKPGEARELVEAMHAKLHAAARFDDILVCSHAESEGCSCRKPKPGLLLRAAAEHGIDLRRSWMVGDRWRDIEAGQAAGCHTIHVDHNYANDPRPKGPGVVVKSLGEAAAHICRRALKSD